ncbi:MAG: hypothetical protein ACOY4W_03170 [Thermodesulfobacteriota bacterium]
MEIAKVQRLGIDKARRGRAPSTHEGEKPMAITCSIDRDQGYMVAIATGPIGWEEVRTHLLAERLAGGLSYRELIDARTAVPTWSSAQAREIVSLLTNFGRKSVLGPHGGGGLQ